MSPSAFPSVLGKGVDAGDTIWPANSATDISRRRQSPIPRRFELRAIGDLPAECLPRREIARARRLPKHADPPAGVGAKEIPLPPAEIAMAIREANSLLPASKFDRNSWRAIGPHFRFDNCDGDNFASGDAPPVGRLAHQFAGLQRPVAHQFIDIELEPGVETRAFTPACHWCAPSLRYSVQYFGQGMPIIGVDMLPGLARTDFFAACQLSSFNSSSASMSSMEFPSHHADLDNDCAPLRYRTIGRADCS